LLILCFTDFKKDDIGNCNFILAEPAFKKIDRYFLLFRRIIRKDETDNGSI